MTGQTVSRSQVAALAVCSIAVALRLPGMFHDFWFDEVWSYLLVREFVSAPHEILTRLHIDNNHPLNSWFLYLFGDQRWWTVYRLPSLIFGAASVMLAGRIMWRRGRAHGLAAMILVGCSYPLIVYASEARGYAPMVFFVLLAVDAHERYLADDGWFTLTVFWCAAVLGVASHLTFLHAYLAILLWSFRRSGSIGRFVRLHAVPLVCLAGFYLVYIRHLHVAGAEAAPLPAVIAETLAVAVGMPGNGAWRIAALILCAWLAVTALATVRRADPDIFRFFLAGILLVPSVTVLLEYRRSPIEPRFFPRYFLVGITLFLLLAAWKFGENHRSGGARRLAGAALLSAYVIGNLWQVFRFANEGRGHYREAVQYLVRETTDAEIRVTSNSDFRTTRLLAFYRRELPPDRVLTLYPAGGTTREPAEWRIVEDVEPRPVMPEHLESSRGQRYRLVKRFSFYGLSGSQWTLYRRVDGHAPTEGAREVP